MSVEVTLSFPQIILAGNGGVLRQVNALRKRLHDPDAHHRDPQESHVSGAQAEYAVSVWLNVPWDPTVGICWAGEVDGDVDGIEVRSTFHSRGCLPIHDYSFDGRPYVLVRTHRAPTYVLVGWLWGAEGKDPARWRPDLPRPCFLNPADALHPMDTLPGYQSRMSSRSSSAAASTTR